MLQSVEFSFRPLKYSAVFSTLDSITVGTENGLFDRTEFSGQWEAEPPGAGQVGE